MNKPDSTLYKLQSLPCNKTKQNLLKAIIHLLSRKRLVE